MTRAQAFFFGQTGDPALSQQMALQALADLRDQQAASLAYFDIFTACAFISAALVPAGLFHEALRGRKGVARGRRMISRGGSALAAKANAKGPGRYADAATGLPLAFCGLNPSLLRISA